MDMTLAERLLLLALDDAKGSAGSTPVDPGLAGALLVDLGRLGALVPEGKLLRPVQVSDIAHPVLARAHGVIAASRKPRTAKSWVNRLPGALRPLTATVAEPLVRRGVLSEERTRFLGLFPTTRFPEANPGPERLLRSRLRAVLLGDRKPEEGDALLIGLLLPLDLIPRLVDREDRRRARRRAKEVAEHGVAGDAVAAAIRDIQAAVTAAVIIPAVTASGS